jgi:hypothetical protein
VIHPSLGISAIPLETLHHTEKILTYWPRWVRISSSLSGSQSLRPRRVTCALVAKAGRTRVVPADAPGLPAAYYSGEDASSTHQIRDPVALHAGIGGSDTTALNISTWHEATPESTLERGDLQRQSTYR